MIPDKPSITIWIDPITQQFKVEFNPQPLAPAQYGIVIASLLIYIARLFVANNSGASETDVIAQIRKGMTLAFEQIDDMVLPAKAH